MFSTCKNPHAAIAATLVFLLLVAGIAFWFAGSGNSSQVESGAIGPSTVIASPSYAEITKQHNTLSNQEWNNYAVSLRGKEIRSWEGIIRAIEDNSITGGKTLRIQMKTPVYDQVLGFNEVWAEISSVESLMLQTGQSVVFHGKIKSVECFGTTCPIILVEFSYSLR